MDDRDGAPPQPGPEAQGTAIDRRDFLRRAGIGAGTLVAGGGSSLLAASPARAESHPVRRRQQDVVVVGAGVFGAWTAYHLQQMGATVTLVDLYGPGNSRSTSGDETRGIRTAYGENTQWSD